MIVIGDYSFLEVDFLAQRFGVPVEEFLKMLQSNKVKYINIGVKYFVREDEFLSLFTWDGIIEKSVISRDIEVEEQPIHKEQVMPITESQILIETINIVKEYKNVTMGQLKQLLRERMILSEEDNMILAGRSDTKFDQKVRNLVAHRHKNTLDQYCEYEKKGRLGVLRIKEEDNE